MSPTEVTGRVEPLPIMMDEGLVEFKGEGWRYYRLNEWYGMKHQIRQPSH
jgi:hypothetical protein